MSAWSWHSGDDTELVLAQGFPTQSEAEAWLTESWPDLLDSGVASVSLFEEGRLVYGPMSLSSEEG